MTDPPGWPWRHYEEGGRQYVTRDDKPVCDFCLKPWVDGEDWTYPTAPMPLQGHPLIQASDDDFAVCNDCHLLLKASKLGELVERSLELQVKHEPPNEWRRYGPLSIRRRKQRENILRFLDARNGLPYQGRP